MIQRGYHVRPSLGSALVGLLVAVLFIYGLFRLAAWTMSTLISGLPIFFGIGLVLGAIAYAVDRRVILGFGRYIGESFRANPLKGIALAALTVVFAPFVFGYLLAKALLLRRVGEAMGAAQERMTEAMRERARQAGGAAAGIGSEDGYREVRRDDGLVIRIPNEQA